MEVTVSTVSGDGVRGEAGVQLVGGSAADVEGPGSFGGGGAATLADIAFNADITCEY